MSKRNRRKASRSALLRHKGERKRGESPRHFWRVKPTGDYGAYCELGTPRARIAREIAAYWDRAKPSEEAPMSDDRRFVISGAALCLAACPVSTSGIGSATSPRIIRLRQLFARVDESRKLPMGGVTDEDLEAVCNEIYDIGNRVWRSPVQGWTDILERALIASYWLDKQAERPNRKPAQTSGPSARSSTVC